MLSSTLTPPAPLGHDSRLHAAGAARALRQPGRRLAVAAGFYPDAALARLVRRSLMDDHGLQLSQITLLAPGDELTERYLQLSRRWTRRSENPVFGMPWWQELLQRVMGKWSRLLPPRRRFDRAVQRQLKAGRWAVLVHGVPPARQAEVVADLRSSGDSWCADAPRRAA